MFTVQFVYNIAEPCVSLFAPINGYMSCNGEHVTDTVCTFTCEPGYNLTGPATRSCLGDHTWSGVETTCPPLQCTALAMVYEGDDSVFVLAPCHNTYNYTCSLLCRNGYYQANDDIDEWKQTCDLVEPNDYVVNWTEPITCIGKYMYMVF